MGSDLDYLNILQALEQAPFGMGRKLLCDVLRAQRSESVRRHRLDKLDCAGSMSGYSEDEIGHMLVRLSANGLIDKSGLPGKPYVKVYEITERGKKELLEPTLNEKKVHARFEASPITDADRELFSAFHFFLKRYNDAQKHAIVSPESTILCVAGAGSGKTTVLTKRIEFLTRFRSVSPSKVLAITFTRKARQEMQRRLGALVQVETFNSFCEKLLQRHGRTLYGKHVRVLAYKDKMRLLHHALNKLHLEPERVLQTYFTTRQRSEKPKDLLMRLFLHDIFSILDYYANNDEELADFSGGAWDAKMVYNICRSISNEMREIGLRDYSDQIKDALRLLREHPDVTPRYEHILVDEYQDVNAVQKQLLDALAPPNLFVVGDPRQSIYGWRGSKVKFILDFPSERKAQTIVLAKNYRSTKLIVALMNACIEPMRMPELTHDDEREGTARLCTFKNEDAEMEFIAQAIASSTVPREEIFVLARTNRQLDQLSDVLRARGIAHVIRSDDERRLLEASQGEVTLSTVHAIKGLEASMVIAAFCNAQSYPCITSDHPVLDLVKREEHDREEEELRLFYVAISRAKHTLLITHSNTPTKFLGPQMRKLLGASRDTTLKTQGASGDLFGRLRAWRTDLSRKAGIPPYMIFPDRTLLELCEKRPDDMAQLFEIKGIGPSKASKYGEEILALLR